MFGEIMISVISPKVCNIAIHCKYLSNCPRTVRIPITKDLRHATATPFIQMLWSHW